MSVFQKATRKQVRLRMALDGPAGSGKTFTGLRFAHALAAEFGGRVAVINTESGAIEKYLGLAPDGIPFDFDIVNLEEYAPSSYTTNLLEAGREGYSVVLIDSLSHAWEGKGGSLDQVDKNTERNKFTAWKDVTPQHRAMIEAILKSPCHIITTMRTKTEYVLEPNERNQMVPRKVGMKPIQREGMEYEFDIVCDLDPLHILRVSKTRCPDIDGAIVMKPGAPFVGPIVRWLKDGSNVSADHFALKESDLEAWKQHDRDKAAQEPKKPVNFREQLAGAGASSSPSTPTTSPAPVVAVATPCTEGQATHIRALFQQLEIPLEAAQGIIAKRNVASVKDLTYDLAESLINSLLAMHRQQVEERRAAQDAADLEAKNMNAKVEGVPF